MEGKNKNTENAEALKVEAQQEQQKQAKKKYDLNTIKYGLELGLKKGAFSSLEEMASIINSFEGLK